MKARLALLLALGSLVVAGTASARIPDEVARSPLADPQHECLEPVPETAGVAGATDDGEMVNVDTLVLLDGIDWQLGKATMDTANESYTPLEITLVPTFRLVRLPHQGIERGMDREWGPTSEGMKLIQEAKDAVGGARPPGFDLVLTLTNKDLFVGGGNDRNYSLGGVADCIGGIRYDEHAFAVSEAPTPWVETVGEDAAGIIAAHEAGHLLGAHHHYGSCVEGEGQDKPCTLMWTVRVELVSPNFGTLEAATVRGHAVDFADD